MSGAGSGLVGLAEIRDAARGLERVAVRTPLIPVARLEPPLLVKPESLQPTGSFKLRGAYTAIMASERAAREHGVVAHSSGNHGHAVAYAAALLGVRAVVVVPRTAPAVKTDAIEYYGAELLRVEPTLAARVAATEELVARHGYVPIPPFDDRAVIAGQGTVGLEIAAQLPDVEAVLVPVSGGGLASGVGVAIKALLPGAKMIGVEPELAGDTTEGLSRGARADWPMAQRARTIADGLRAQPSELTFAHLSAVIDEMVTVTEAEIREAVVALAHRARLITEPSGAVTTAARLFHADTLPPGRTIAIVSGGNIDPALLAELLA